MHGQAVLCRRGISPPISSWGCWEPLGHRGEAPTGTPRPPPVPPGTRGTLTAAPARVRTAQFCPTSKNPLNTSNARSPGRGPRCLFLGQQLYEVGSKARRAEGRLYFNKSRDHVEKNLPKLCFPSLPPSLLAPSPHNTAPAEKTNEGTSASRRTGGGEIIYLKFPVQTQDQIIANGSLPALFHSEILKRDEKWKPNLCVCSKKMPAKEGLLKYVMDMRLISWNVQHVWLVNGLSEPVAVRRLGYLLSVYCVE